MTRIFRTITVVLILMMSSATLLHAQQPAVMTVKVKGVSFKMVRVQGGTFTMGATAEQGSDADSDEKPAHKVTLSNYYIGETEVTQQLWEAVMGSNPSEFKPQKSDVSCGSYDSFVNNAKRLNAKKAGTVRIPTRAEWDAAMVTSSGSLKRPVECVSWNDCQEFIRRLNALTGKKFRLPTEAEWEYAARGGSKSRKTKYAGSNNIGDVAWYWDNIPSQTSGTDGYGTQPVATKAPNELGLYDMSGNVYERCQDWYGAYSSAAQTNPTGPTSGSYRVNRGGCWGDARICRVSFRSHDDPSSTNYNLGLRLAL